MNETRDDRIRESIEEIEPAAGAKERMLENIRRKAAAQNAEPESRITQVNTIAPYAGESETRRKSNRRIVILRNVVLAAACVALAIFGAVKLLPGKPDAPVIGTDVITAGGTLILPEEAANVTYATEDTDYTKVSFDYKGWKCELYVSESADALPEFGKESEQAVFDAKNDATYCELPEAGGKYKLTWKLSGKTYVLLGPGGMGTETIRELYQKIY